VPDGRRRSSDWNSFVADREDDPGRSLHEIDNARHRLRVEHDARTLLIHLSDEDGKGWTVFAVDRETRRWSAAQGRTQLETATRAVEKLRATRED
jgi:hypothetical protein